MTSVMKEFARPSLEIGTKRTITVRIPMDVFEWLRYRAILKKRTFTKEVMVALNFYMICEMKKVGEIE